MKVNTLERALVETFSNKHPSRATVHQCTQMIVSLSSLSGSSNQELGSQAAWRVAQEFPMSLFPSFLNDYFEVSQSVKWLVGIVVIVTDRFQNSPEDGMCRRPNRDSLDLVATTCWFLHDDSPRNEDERHHAHKTILEYVQKAHTIFSVNLTCVSLMK